MAALLCTVQRALVVHSVYQQAHTRLATRHQRAPALHHVLQAATVWAMACRRCAHLDAMVLRSAYQTRAALACVMLVTFVLRDPTAVRARYAIVAVHWFCVPIVGYEFVLFTYRRVATPVCSVLKAHQCLKWFRMAHTVLVAHPVLDSTLHYVLQDRIVCLVYR